MLRNYVDLCDMSERYKTHEEGLFFVTLTVVGWVDLFTRAEYAEVFLESLRYCIRQKGLRVYAFCIMPSHIHLIADLVEDKRLLAHVLRDLKSYTAKALYTLVERTRRKAAATGCCGCFSFMAGPTGRRLKSGKRAIIRSA